jgi:hypothetical protein
MASINTTERTAQLENDYKRNASPSFRKLQQNLRLAQFAEITITGDSDAADDDIVLGKLGLAGTIIPEQCSITSTNGAIDCDFTLEKVSTDGTVTALTGAASVAADDTPVAFARKAGGVDGSAFAETDYLQLTLSTPGAIAADDTLEVLLTYASEEAP